MASKLSESDVAILVSAIKNSSKPIIDFEAVAQECKLNSKDTAYKRHWAIMRKLGVGTTNSNRGRPKANKNAKKESKPVPIADLALDSITKKKPANKRKAGDSLTNTGLKRMKKDEDGDDSASIKSEDFEELSDDDGAGPETIDTPCKKRVSIGEQGTVLV